MYCNPHIQDLRVWEWKERICFHFYYSIFPLKTLPLMKPELIDSAMTNCQQPFLFFFLSFLFSHFLWLQSLPFSPLHPIIHVRFKDNLNHLLRLKVHSCKSLVFICKRNVQPYRIYFIEILTFALAYVSINSDYNCIITWQNNGLNELTNICWFIGRVLLLDLSFSPARGRALLSDLLAVTPGATVNRGKCFELFYFNFIFVFKMFLICLIFIF